MTSAHVLALVVSGLAHAIAIVILTPSAPAAVAPRTAAPVEPNPVAVVEPEPMVVEIMTLPDEVVTAAIGPPAVAIATTGSAVAAETGVPVGSEAPRATPTPPASSPAPHDNKGTGYGHALMKMRRQSVAESLTSQLSDEALEHPPPPPPRELQPGDTAHAYDRQVLDLAVKVANPDYIASHTAEEVAAAREDLAELETARDNVRIVPAGGGRYRSELERFGVDIEADGTAHIRTKGRDLTQVLTGGRGGDPYASNKKVYLERTFDERVAIGQRGRAERLSRSAELMQGNIARLYAQTTDPRARREGLFELWDECAEAGEGELLAGATAARTFVLGVIRGLHGADAFPAAELAALNAHRHSKAPLAP